MDFRQYLEQLCLLTRTRSWTFSPYEYLLRNGQDGRAYVPAHHKGPAKRCVDNSVKMISRDGGRKYGYMEGLVGVHIPITHAWNVVRRTGDWIDTTIRDAARWPYFGVEIPVPVVLIAAQHRYWTVCTGVLETIAHFSLEELEFVRDLLPQMESGLDKKGPLWSEVVDQLVYPRKETTHV